MKKCLIPALLTILVCAHPRHLNSTNTTNFTNSTNSTNVTSLELYVISRSWQEFISGTVQSFTVIVSSEIGDKSFMLTAAYAQRFNSVLIGTIAAIVLCAIHIVSTMLGASFSIFIPKLVTESVQIGVFIIFSFLAIAEAVISIHKRYLRRKQGLPESSDSDEELK